MAEYRGGLLNGNPLSRLKVNGSVILTYRGITALRTVDATDYLINCTANTFTVILPTAAGITIDMHSGSANNLSLTAIAAASTPTRPAVSSVILAINKTGR